MHIASGLIFKAFRRLALVTAVLTAASPSVHADAFDDARQLLQANQLTRGLAVIETYLKDQPSDVRMRFLKSVFLRRQGMPDEAIEVLTQLTQDFPELAEPYNNLAVLYASLGQYDKARSALEVALRNNPSYATAHENLGDVYAKLASEAYARSFELDASNTSLQPKLNAIDVMLRRDAVTPAAAQ